MDGTFRKQIGKHGEVRAEPRPSQEELDTFYRDLYYGDGVTTTYSSTYDQDEMAQKRLRAKITVEALVQALPEHDTDTKILEIGSGEGFVLAEAKDRDLTITGVDYQIGPIKAFNPKIIENFTATDPNEFLQKQISEGAVFDGIVLQNVLEHVRDPESLLAGLRTIMSETGVLLVQVPNDFSSLQSLAMKKGRIKKESWFAPPQHLTYWNTDNIRPYMAEHGFQVIDGFTDFPIETFLWGAPTNYTQDRSFGPHAHRGRVELDLFFAEAGLAAYLDLYRAFFRVGFGRNLVVLLRKA